MEIALIISIFLIAAGLIVSIAWFYDRQRSKALHTFADSMDFSFERKGNESLIAMNDDFELFSHGRSKKIYNVMTGRSGDMDITIMDYHYKTDEGKNSQTVILVQSRYLLLPPFSLSPENLVHKIGGVFDYHNINFTSHPKFSEHYLLKGDDEDTLRETFNDKLIEFYEKDNILNTEGYYDKFVHYKTSKKLSPKEIKELLQEGINLCGLFKAQTAPQYLYAQN